MKAKYPYGVPSRDVAAHLYRLNSLLVAEAARHRGLAFVEAYAQAALVIEQEAADVLDLANELHELKEVIGKLAAE